MRWTFEAELLLLHMPDGDLAYVEVPASITDEIRAVAPRKAFGSNRIDATIGTVSWSTVLVSDRESGNLTVPVKKQVRVSCGLAAGEIVSVAIELAAAA
ncbi:DUF1905 domain-containing protein [Antrihabitans sp. YC2-6]|uniref:DUF1905 domain-containing protein n=1 Tax=Antrihabitans sp. YC2-6 TaxID=2799498 RepID=UPI0018F4458A|nr:DUF1905 domain-containing protein [Antrihabitans sp. YC2-6]MBJ8348348.1 DUF1905 domain-containing protein [Antrihabitans sp. YC2-6]